MNICDTKICDAKCNHNHSLQTEIKQGGRFSYRLDNKGNDAFSAVLQIKVIY